MGAAALLVSSSCPPGHSPSHRWLDPVWHQIEDADIPVVFHVGGTGDLIDRDYFLNGLPIPPDFHGGEENFRSVDYMAIPFPPMQTLATMVFDGVFDGFPRLRVGVIEQGAIWVPSWMRQMESAFEAFAQARGAGARPADAAERLRASSDEVHAVPHRGRRLDRSSRPAPRWCCSTATTRTWRVVAGRSSGSSAASATADESVRQAFYCDNFLELMGAAARHLAA